MKVFRTARFAAAFTLTELLVVISIIGLLAALSVPALKQLGKSNLQVSATRQLMDDIARARQLAISQRTTVYMVFVPTNLITLNFIASLNSYAGFKTTAEKADALVTATNLSASQLSGYNFISYGKMGDQPGQHEWSYLSEWKTLPEGAFIAAPKFQSHQYSLSIPEWWKDFGGQVGSGWTAPANWIAPVHQVYQIAGFARQLIPFPTGESPAAYLPCIAFDYRGQLVSEADTGGGYHAAYIPLAQGSVSYGMDANKQPNFAAVNVSDIEENLPGNSTNISYNVIAIDPLTGRTTLQRFKMQ